MIGYGTEPDDFFVVGETLFDAPVIWCRIYGPSGDLLLGLEKNKLTPDSQGKYRQVGFHRRPGWCIQDDAGKNIFAVETVAGEEAKRIVQSLAERLGKEDEMAHIAIEELAPKASKITRIYGEFFDKHGRLAAWGNEAGLSLNCPAEFGQRG